MKNELRERNYYGLRDSLFDNIFFPYEHKENNMMKTDVKENENDYELQVEVPGVSKENISIDYENGYVTIAAKTNKSKDEKDKEGNYIMAYCLSLFQKLKLKNKRKQLLLSNS